MFKIHFALSPRFTKWSINKGRDVISSASETVECGHFATFPLSLWWFPCSMELMAPCTVDHLPEVLSTELNKVVMVVAGLFPETLEATAMVERWQAVVVVSSVKEEWE